MSYLKYLLAAFMVFAGVMHFVRPRPFVAIVPKALPAPLLLVHISGIAEILLGAGLLLPATQSWAAWGLIALYVAIFPANINMAVHRIQLNPHRPLAAWMLWARLPLQAVLIAWAWAYTQSAPEVAVPPPQPVPLALIAANNAALGFAIDLPDTVTAMGCNATSCRWRSDEKDEIEVTRLGPDTASLEAAIAAIGGHDDEIDRRSDGDGNVVILKQGGNIWYFRKGPAGWFRSHCRVGKGTNLGRGTWQFSDRWYDHIQAACVSLRPLP